MKSCTVCNTKDVVGEERGESQLTIHQGDANYNPLHANGYGLTY